MPSLPKYRIPISWKPLLLALLFGFSWLAALPARAAYPGDCDVQTEIPFESCVALVDLYNSTNGPGWADAGSNNWLGTLTPCSWVGVGCADGDVGSLDRRQQNLVGTLPASLGNLTRLTFLDLGDNQLSGAIPPELGGLTGLTYLSLLNNDLSGSIPPGLGNLSGLTFLDLGSNQLTGNIPPELGGLGELDYLSLVDNQLTGSIPPALGNLGRLTALDLGGNQLSGPIPPELGALAHLGYLSLVGNQLTGGIPPQLGNLASLLELLLDGNPLGGSIPPSLGNLANLQRLSLVNVQLTGSIPPELGGLAQLQAIELSYNHLAGDLPAGLGNLPNLRVLDLTFNQLTGQLPPGLSTQGGLQKLWVSGNALSGTIPALPAGLIDADLGYNLFTAETGGSATLKNPDWAATQTVPPADVTVSATSADSVTLSWTPIPYTTDPGYYQIGYSTTPGGPYQDGGVTADKLAGSHTVGGLGGGTYYFLIQTVTFPHALNQNHLASAYSPEIAASTSTHTLSVVLAGDGGGSVTSQPPGIDCGTLCSAAYAPGTSVTLTATPAAGFVFGGWLGDCAGSAPTASVLMDAPKTCSAVFSVPRIKALSVTQDTLLLESGTSVVDYGSIPLGAPLVKTYTVTNTGTGDVQLLGAPAFVSGGLGFSVPNAYAPVPLTLPPGGSAHFEVALDGGAAGSYAGKIGIPNDTITEVFTFDVHGSVVVPVASLQVFDGAVEVINGIGAVYFGSTLPDVPITKSLVIQNNGENAIQVGSPSASGGFSVANFPAQVPPGGRVPFLVTLEAAWAGPYSGLLRFENSDPAQNPFVFYLNGFVEVPNPPPHDLYLSNDQIDEGLPVGTLVGTFSSSDADAGNYGLVAGAGDADNAAFQISGNQLRTGAVFVYREQATYSIRVQTVDSAGQSYSRAFSIHVAPVNQPPTGIGLSGNSLLENQPPGTAVGTFSTVDEDPDDTHVYTLVAGDGDSGNGAFYIADNVLFSAQTFDYEARSTYSIRVQSDDGRGGAVASAFNVHVLPQSVLVGQLSAGWKHTCALEIDGRARCWGWNNFGQAGPPRELGALRHLSAGSTHTCVVRDDASLLCWGNNQSGQSRVPGGRDYAQVSAGGSHSCALKQDGGAVCWGYDFNGQATPPADEDFVQIGAGGFHTCALKSDGSLVCWGWNNYGQSRPPEGRGYTALSSGEYHSCALAEEGRVRCWGKDFHRQASPPEQGGFVQVSAGEEHTCALHGDGYVACWGLNADGQASPPVDNRDFTQVSAGGNYTCAVRKDGNIVCWGVSDQGQATPPAAVPNRAPGDIFLEVEPDAAGRPAGTLVGTLRSEDLDSEDTHTYRLVAGEGDADNALFRIEGERLLTDRPDLAAGEYRIRVETDDGHNGRLAKALLVGIH